MGYNVRVPLVFGELKIKSYSRLRVEERDRLVPVYKLGQTYYIWRSYSKPTADAAGNSNRNLTSTSGDTSAAGR